MTTKAPPEGQAQISESLHSSEDCRARSRQRDLQLAYRLRRPVAPPRASWRYGGRTNKATSLTRVPHRTMCIYLCHPEAAHISSSAPARESNPHPSASVLSPKGLSLQS